MSRAPKKIEPAPPTAAHRKHVTSHFNDQREDPFYWMRDRENPNVMKHLKDENRFTDQCLQSALPLKKSIERRLRSRVKEEDQSVPYDWQGHSYYYRWHSGLEHPKYYRKQTQGGLEELILDLNSFASDEGFIELGSFEVSPDGKWLMFTLDQEGDETYELYFKDLDRNQLIGGTRTSTSGDCTWLADSQHFAYVAVDEQTRPYQVNMGALGSPAKQDRQIFTDKDPAFFVSVDTTRSGDFVVISSASNDTSEDWLLDAHHPQSNPTLVMKRAKGVEYDIDHQGKEFLLTTNADGAEDFQVWRSHNSDWRQQVFNWQIFLEHQSGRLIESVACFSEFIAIQVRVQLRQDIYFFDPKGTLFRTLRYPLDAYELHEDINVDYKSRHLRLEYSSPKEPRKVFTFDPFAAKEKLLKQAAVPFFHSEEYESRLLWAHSSDGARIPIVVTGKSSSWDADDGSPCYLTGYGAYGVSMSCDFSRDHLTLMDLGFLVATAHIRGGSELGRAWYESGKQEYKENTFADFIACAEHLIQQGLTSSDKLVASGGSAGGMLMGVVLNRKPQLWKSVAALVPFVDVLNTMLDESLLLTPMEYPEWGNPKEEKAYKRIRAYSPYDNVRHQDYPAIYVTAGLNDPRVTYWEPAKWVAKLREHQTANRIIALRVHMDAGHQGATGRYSYLSELAEEWTFHCMQLNIAPTHLLEDPIEPA